MLIGGEFPRSSQFKKFLNVVLHRNAVGKSQLVEIGSFAPPGGGKALRPYGRLLVDDTSNRRLIDIVYL